MPWPSSSSPSPGDHQGLSPVLLAALEQTRSAACITTADLDAPGPTIVYVNPAYCAMTGRDRSDVIGSSPRLMQGPLTDRSVLDRLRQELDAGQGFSAETVNYRADGTPFLISWSIDPVRDADDVVTHFVATQEDVTHQVRSQNLLEATQTLDRTLTAVLNSTLGRETARQTLVDAIADGTRKIVGTGSVSVVLIDDDDGTETLSGPAASTYTGGTPDALRVTFGQGVSQSRGELAISDLTSSERAFVDTEGLDRYGERAALVAGSLLEYQRQRATAIRLQRSLLPPSTIVIPGFDIVSEYLPGAAGLEIGGDWFDAMAIDGRLTISVGDVSGSGIDAASLMGRLRLLGAHELARGTDVPEVLSILDAVCLEVSQMATMQIAQIDTETGQVALWSAGHLPPVVFSPKSTELHDVDVAPPLGFLGGAVVPHTSLQLDVDAGLFLYTDGLVERRAEIITAGLERLRKAVEGAPSIQDMVKRGLEAAGDQVADDVAIIAVVRR